MRDVEENQQFFQVNCTGGLVVEVPYDSDQVALMWESLIVELHNSTPSNVI